MTADVKDELSRVEARQVCCRKAETASVLRMADGLQLVSGKIVVEARAGLRVGRPSAPGRHHRPLRADRGDGGDPARRAAAQQPVRRPGGGGRRGTRAPDRAHRRTRAAGARTPHGRGVGRDVRRRRIVARGVPGARIADRAGPVELPGGHLPRPRGGPRHGRNLAPDRDRRQVPGRAGGGPRGDPGRRVDRGDADPDGRPCQRAQLGGAPDAPRGQGDREPARQLRRREPAALCPGRCRRRRPGPARSGDPRRRGPRAPGRPPASCGWTTARPAWRSWARWPTRR